MSKKNGSGTSGSIRSGGIERSDAYYSNPTTEKLGTANNGLMSTQTYFDLKMTDSDRYFDNVHFYNLIHTNNSNAYWIASRFADTSFVGGATADSGVGFGMWAGNRSENHLLGSAFLCNSWNNEGEYNLFVRPVVTLNTNIQLYGGDGSAEHPYQLTK